MSETLLSISGLSKAYPGVVANEDVSFDIRRGEVHALLGENGAGKSTLVKMIYGLVRPDSGSMTLNGAPFSPAEPRVARASGVAMVFQHFSLFEALNVAENIALGMENPPAMRDLARKITDVSEAYGLPLDPARLVGHLSAGERQRVEIIRCLLQDPKLLIMDEPTSVLTPQEVDILFANEEELLSLYETRDFDAAVELLRQDTGLAAITRSEKGSVVIGDGEPIAVPAEPVSQVVDTTGAGDQYAAGFLFGIARDLPLATCAKLGHIAAAEVISHYGPRPEVSLADLAKAAGIDA